MLGKRQNVKRRQLSVNWPPRAARLALAIIRGEDFPPDMTLENGGGVPVPSYIETPIAVFTGNIDAVIRDGFHSREDGYRSAGIRR